MCNMITHTFYCFPRNLWTTWQKLLLSSFINAFYTFSNGFN